MSDECSEDDLESLPLPKNWSENVRHAILNVVGIVRIALLSGREVLIRNGNSSDAQIYRLKTEVAMLREELRIIGVCTGLRERLDSRCRYRPQSSPRQDRLLTFLGNAPANRNWGLRMPRAAGRATEALPEESPVEFCSVFVSQSIAFRGYLHKIWCH